MTITAVSTEMKFSCTNFNLPFVVKGKFLSGKTISVPTFLHGTLHSSDVCNYTGTMIYGILDLWTSSLEREKHHCSDVLSLDPQY